MQDILYSTLMKSKRNYDIVLLREQRNYSFQKIAQKYGISSARAREIYRRMKYKQLSCYIRHISFVLGYDDIHSINKIVTDVWKCYLDKLYVLAYLEKEYKDILDEYRQGEPGMPEYFIRKLPPLVCELNEESIQQIVRMRDETKLSFSKIAPIFYITPAKAKHIYTLSRADKRE